MKKQVQKATNANQFYWLMSMPLGKGHSKTETKSETNHQETTVFCTIILLLLPVYGHEVLYIQNDIGKDKHHHKV